MRGAAVVALLAWAATAHASPEQRDQRYDGPRLAFSAPEGTKVQETSDIAADYAVELTSPDAKLAQTTLRILLSNSKVSDADLETIAGAWRDARLRNRGSWGVKKRAEDRAEVMHLGSRRVVRYSDQMGSVLGASRQLMLCASVRGRLVCGLASGPAASEPAAEAILVRALETISVKKHAEAK